MESLLDTLRECGLLDSGVLATGVERGWASSADVAVFAAERLRAGDDRAEVAELAAAEDLEQERLVDRLRDWARLDRLPSQHAENAFRRWMFAVLTSISSSGTSPEEKLDRLEEAYAMFGYPEELQKCSRYYVPPQDRARGIRVGEVTDSPLEEMNKLLSQLKLEFACEPLP